ncbi:MAG: lipocalin family protein [Bacteroidales bacterium]|nr:lipocalin family protein [Bacteroidales bacterium]
MKKRNLFMLFCIAVSLIGLTSCNRNQGNTTAENFNPDKMLGTWKLVEYSSVATNLDENVVTEQIKRTEGTLWVTKKDGDYYYTENFMNENGKQYSGRLTVNGNVVRMAEEDGFLRTDVDTYDMTVKELTDKKMEWSYERTYTHYESGTDGTSEFKEKRVVSAIFTK